MLVKIYIVSLIVLLELGIDNLIGLILLMLDKQQGKFMSELIDLMLVHGYYLEFSLDMLYRKTNINLIIIKL